MTREEARRIIAIWLVSSKGEKGQRGYIEGWFDEEDVEAFRMAIEALQTDIVRCEDCKYKGKVGDVSVCRIHEISTRADDYCSRGERSSE